MHDTQQWITDGGIETALVDRLGQDLPEFAAFVLLDSAEGRRALREYYAPFIELADASDLPIVLDTPTWRANPDWGELLGADDARLERINEDAAAFVREVADEIAPDAEVVVNGCVGPRSDEFEAERRMTAEEAQRYHAPQVAALAAAGADRITAVTVLDAAEGIGVARAAMALRVPAFVSFTVGGDGRMADGSSLSEAIAEADAATGGGIEGYLVNCAHPSEVAEGLRDGSAALSRIAGFRLNAAREGDDGPGDEPTAFAAGVLALRALAPNARVFGGCCGTDAPHLDALAGLLRGTPASSR